MECKALTIFHGGVNTVCFNRNIVECKGAYSKGESAEELVLIETLWNVKVVKDTFEDNELKF